MLIAIAVPDTYRLIEMVAHGIRQRSDGVVQDEEILVLVLSEGKHQRVQDEAQVGDELRARLFLQSGKRTEWEKQTRTNVKFLVRVLRGDANVS